MIGMVMDVLSGIGRKPPRVVVAERVLRKMAAGAALYRDEETAEALIGLVIPVEGQSEPDLYVLDTIAPDQSAIERQAYMVSQGDDWQDEVMYWLAINWKRFRERRRGSYGSALAAKWDAPLRYLGDWHKQPGGMFWPSQGDLMTALDILHDDANDMPQLLAPIVTLVSPGLAGPEIGEYDLYVTPEAGPEDEPHLQPIRVNFWYLSRKMRQFVAARPEVMSDDVLPALPPLGWHLRDRDRFRREVERLADDGLAVSVVEWDADAMPPLETCFMVARVGGEFVHILVTDKNYPETPPTVRLAPLIQVDDDEDLFERLWDESRELDLDEAVPDWTWEPERTLLELVQAVEAQVTSFEF